MISPTFAVIAGANGCGKSTLTLWAKGFFQQSAILDPDAVVVDLRAQTNATLSDIEAGREVLRLANEYLKQRTSFSVETTLSGNTYLRMLERANGLGYRTRLFYIGTESVQVNAGRVASRVLKGGHSVPMEDQLRHDPRSFRNLVPALQLAGESALFDNSSEAGHRVIGVKLPGTGLLLIEPLPAWAEFLRQDQQ